MKQITQKTCQHDDALNPQNPPLNEKHADKNGKMSHLFDRGEEIRGDKKRYYTNTE